MSETNENEFEIDGVKYRAADAPDGSCVSGRLTCAFLVDGDCLVSNEGKASCLPSMRADGKSKIFVEVKP
jgi:hypothetical protein